MDQPLVQLKNVCKKFGQNVVLRNVNLSIYKGEVTTIIGKSGGGKSVLLKHIIGLMEPDSGQILFNGRQVSEMDKKERHKLKKKFSYMFQGTALFDYMTVLDNIALPLRETTSMRESEILDRVHNMLEQLDLHEIDGKYPSQLSGGMKKRVAMARALITEPEIVLFDEPTTGLDPIRKNAVHSMISSYQKKFEYTGVLVSHEIPDIFYISQRVAMLDNGTILFEGTTDELQRSSEPKIRQFIHGFDINIKQDKLTGMGTKIDVEQSFMESMERLQEDNLLFSIIIFYIDNMDKINETAGHVAGQTVVKNFSVQLKECLRFGDTCVRYGLDKVLLILPGANKAQAQAFCSKLADKIKWNKHTEPLSCKGLRVSISAGLAEADKLSRFDRLLSSAESQRIRLDEFCAIPEAEVP
jgi:phospholipid/cholesterol/gamma-HCH transport system ATP-binding protein